MAYLTRLCEPARQCFRHWRQCLRAQCPLCGLACAAGALCVHCRALLRRDHDAAAWRCPRCSLAGTRGCAQCDVSVPLFERAIAAFDYRAPQDLLIHELKLRHRLHLVPVLGGLLAEAVTAAWPGMPEDAILLPVPSSRAALARRGFNPAGEIARDLARRLGRDCRPDLLRRVREGPRQASLGRRARLAAAARMYDVNGPVSGLRLVVVDDVMTTAGTVNAVAGRLLAAGASSVHVFVVARTPVLPVS